MLFSSQHLCYNMQSQRKLYPSIATSITRYHLATCHTTKKFHREQICHRMWNTWSTPVESKLPNNCRVSRIVVIIYFQLCILTHFLDLLKGNIMLLTFFFLYLGRYSGFFLSASFHSQCPQGSLAKGKRRGRAEEVMQALAPENYVKEPNMTLRTVLFFFPILRFTHF